MLLLGGFLQKHRLAILDVQWVRRKRPHSIKGSLSIWRRGTRRTGERTRSGATCIFNKIFSYIFTRKVVLGARKGAILEKNQGEEPPARLREESLGVEMPIHFPSE